MWWLGGPSSRIWWPNPCLVNSRISAGVSRIDTVSAMRDGDEDLSHGRAPPLVLSGALCGQRLSQNAESGGVRRLHQDHVAGLQFGPQQRQGGVAVGHVHSLGAP